MPGARPPTWGALLLSRTIAAVLILLAVFVFVLVLLNRGVDLKSALLGAGGGGVVAAEITHRLLGAALPPTDTPQAPDAK